MSRNMKLFPCNCFVLHNVVRTHESCNPSPKEAASRYRYKHFMPVHKSHGRACWPRCLPQTTGTPGRPAKLV